GARGAKRGNKVRCGPAKHVQGAEQDRRVPRAGTHYAGCRHPPEVDSFPAQRSSDLANGDAHARRRGDRMSAPGKAGAIQPVKVRPQKKGSVLLSRERCVATGDGGCEAYTAIAWGVGLSHERSDIAGAEGFHSLEGNR